MQGAPTPYYTSFADAAAVRDSYFAACFAWTLDNIFFGLWPAPLSFTSDATVSNQLTVAMSVPPFANRLFFVYLSIAAGGDISIPFSITGNAVVGADTIAQLTACGTSDVVAFDSTPTDLTTSSGTFHFTAVPAGTYFLTVLFSSGTAGSLPGDYSITVIGTVTTVFLPAVIMWNDGVNGLRTLEKCPRLYLPIHTETTNVIYASALDAQAALDDHVVGCLVYYTNVALGTAGFASSVLSIGQCSGGGDAYAAINVAAGDTLTITGNVASSGAMAYQIFDSDFILLESGGGTFGPSHDFTYVVPFSGKLIIKVGVAGVDWTIISSGALTANIAQALYHAGVSCPARLDCVEEDLP